MSMVMIYITNKDAAEAKKVAKHLLAKKLVACANIFPITSMYWWKEKIVDDQEVVCIVKTSQGRCDDVEQEVKKIHSYECPCIIKIPVVANKEYEDWLNNQINP